MTKGSRRPTSRRRVLVRSFMPFMLPISSSRLKAGRLTLLLTVVSLILSYPMIVRSQIHSSSSAKAPVDFNREIRPILSENCFMCHGPDEKMRMAHLRFDTRDGAFAKPRVIVPGDSMNSELIRRVLSEDDAVRMPAPASGRTLSEAQISLLRRWIDEGAKWNTHWAYIPPRRPDIPEVGDKRWPRNPIDHFILQRLEKEGLHPSPEADKPTLLRRLSYDLTGLPPTPEELDSFLADSAAGAYERQVDRFLHSLHYGERLAMPWLDLARYADTHGYHIDSHREMWHGRDWVIDAFNRNMPFDRFTIEQLAGDLLPDATLEQKVASGFNRNHMINFEGGAIPEEYQVEYVVDRVETTSNTWMGMTMGCARCHSHKFDPISQKEFYQFFAFFNNVPEEGLDGQTGNAKPFLQLPSREQKDRLDRLDSAIKEREAILSDKEVAPLQEEWEKRYRGKLAPSPRDGLQALYELDGNFSDISGGYRHGRTLKGDPTFAAGRVGKAASFDGDTMVSFAGVGSFDREDAFTIAFWLNGEGNTPLSVMQKMDETSGRRGYEITLDDLALIGIQRRAARLNFHMSSGRSADAIQVRTSHRIPLGEWHHVAVRYDGTGRAGGVSLSLDGRATECEIRQDSLSSSIRTGSDLQIGGSLPAPSFRGQIDDLRVYTRGLSEEELRQLAEEFPVLSALSGVTGKRTTEEASRIRDYFLCHAAPPAMRKSNSELADLKKQKTELEKEIPTTMVMGVLEKPRETYVLARGDYRNRTEKVEPAVPAVLPPLPRGAAPNRLTLARWLVDPSHPLTARVAVNRFWQLYFGTGIVKTSEDFGSQGEPPTHPELLDWLATEFQRTGWDVRALQRMIVTSATYRQCSSVTPELLERDPENRLLARGARFRLPAEMVRDSALSVAGLLQNEIGGPGVRPYQPKGIWEELAFGDGFSAQSYTQGSGADLYRRSMYTFWKRTAPPPSLTVFDAPDREKCTGRRSLTNTPLQALVLLNDPTYVEAARALAARVIAGAGKRALPRIAYAFRLATARTPSESECAMLRELYTRSLTRFRAHPDAAAEFLQVGEFRPGVKIAPAELAAWTTVASAILNLDETISKQ